MTKLEEIARAIGMLNGAANSQDGLLWAWSSQERRNECLEFARVAVENIREPTARMILASPAISWMSNGWDGRPRELSSADSYRAMIDTILNEKESP